MRRTDSKKPTILTTVEIEQDLHRNAKSAIAKKGKTMREVVEKALTREVATAK